jgi:hypothetical protein
VWRNGSAIGGAPSASGGAPSASGGAPAASAENEASIRQLGKRVLEGTEVSASEGIDRPAGRSGGANPPLQHRRTRALGRLVKEVEQNRELRAVIELSGEERQRVGIECLTELIIAQAEEVHQSRRGRTLGRITDRPLIHDRIVAVPARPRRPDRARRAGRSQPARAG